MMFSIRFFKTKYAGLIGMFFSLVMFMTGCQRKDEAIVLIPSGDCLLYTSDAADE